MLTDASVLETGSSQRPGVLARPYRRSLVLAVRSFIVNRVDVTDELVDLALSSLFVALTTGATGALRLPRQPQRPPRTPSR